MASKVTEEYGSLVFSDSVMRERLPKPTYKELSRVIKEGKALNLAIANEVAHAMKEWALEKGATHYTHWFQPLTGITVREARQPSWSPPETAAPSWRLLGQGS